MTRRDAILAGVLSAFPARAQTAVATLPKLPYAYGALEPHIDARTMELHHGRHHQAYVDNLNKALAAHPDLQKQPLERLLANLAAVPDSIRAAVRNNGGGHFNHSLFWRTLGKSGGSPGGKLAGAIARSFGSQAAFVEKLRAAGLTVFGSGWIWVTPTPEGALRIETAPNQDSPAMAGTVPLLGIDVWEHAYYLKYQQRRGEYLAAVTQVIDWNFVSRRYEELTR